MPGADAGVSPTVRTSLSAPRSIWPVRGQHVVVSEHNVGSVAMEQGIRVALIVAAAVCLAAGFAWDHLMGDAPRVDARESGDVAQRWVSVDALGRERPVVSVSYSRGGDAFASSTEETPASARGDVAVTPEANAQPASEELTVYTVERGDTPREISERVYGTDRHWRVILEANDLEPGETFEPGQRLRVPALPE